MSSKSKVAIFFILVIILCIGAYLFKCSIDEKETNEVATNTVNTANNEVENKIENTQVVENNTVENNTVAENKTTSNIVTTNTEETQVDDKEKAIKIAKEAWGDTDGVYFAIQGMKSNGDYIVTVSADAKVLAYYYVNCSTGAYTVEYN